MTACAQQKPATSTTNFRSPPENGHSRYGCPTARFAPRRTLARLGIKVSTGWKAEVQRASAATGIVLRFEDVTRACDSPGAKVCCR